MFVTAVFILRRRIGDQLMDAIDLFDQFVIQSQLYAGYVFFELCQISRSYDIAGYEVLLIDPGKRKLR